MSEPIASCGLARSSSHPARRRTAPAAATCVKLAPQPFKVLELLARRGGEVVTRDEIRDHVWRGDTFVDFEQGLNFCIRQIREALGDTADAPRFIETLPRRGYRFLMPVEPSRRRPARPRHAPDRAAVPHAAAGPRDGLSGLQPARRADQLARRASNRWSCDRAWRRRASRGDAVDPEEDRGRSRRGRDRDRHAAARRDRDPRRRRSSPTPRPARCCGPHTAQTPVGDLFRVQDELTRRIVASLSLPLTAREQQMLRRDVPASPKAYEYFLRGNQLSHDAKQWSVARDLYLRCVEEDPRLRAGVGAPRPDPSRDGQVPRDGNAGGSDRAEAAFRRALDLNPDLPIAHKLFAQLEVDLGRAHDAMARLIERAHSADPELLAGLVSACRYCGLLDASVAAHARARLEPKIRTSVAHTWFLQGDHARVATIKMADYPYIVALSLAALGRGEEALPRCASSSRSFRPASAISSLQRGPCSRASRGEHRGGRRIRGRLPGSRGLFYLSRHLAHLDEVSPALDLLERVVAGGFFCFPAMARDPWLDPLRKKPAFTKLLRRAEAQHREAAKCSPSAAARNCWV